MNLSFALEIVLLFCLLGHTIICCFVVVFLRIAIKNEKKYAASKLDVEEESDDEDEECDDYDDVTLDDDDFTDIDSLSINAEDEPSKLVGESKSDKSAEDIFKVISSKWDIYRIAEFLVGEKKNNFSQKYEASLLLQALIGYVWLECSNDEKNMHSILRFLSDEKKTLEEVETEFSFTAGDVLFEELATSNRHFSMPNEEMSTAVIENYESYKRYCNGARLPVINHCIGRLMPYYYGFSLKTKKYPWEYSWKLTDPEYLVTGLTRRENMLNNMIDDAYAHYENAFKCANSQKVSQIPVPPTHQE